MTKLTTTKNVTPTALALLLCSFTVLGLLYSAAVPIFEASDEVWHYPMVQHIAEHWTLPVQPLEPGAPSGPWRQEASQPPLYYALAAALTAWIDTGDLAQVRHLNPHVAAGEATPDGSNPNLVVHNPALERFPWRGTVLAVHIARLLSVLLGTWAVYLTWALVRELYPQSPGLALIAAAIHAFTPMYMFISASVNNDNLVVPLCSLALLMMVRIVKSQKSEVESRKSKVKSYLALGVVIGLGLLTKASAIALLPFAAATIAWEAWQNLQRQIENQKSKIKNHPSLLPTPYSLLPKIALHALRNLALVFLPALAISGWWFYRNFRLYGDWLGLNAFYAVLGTRDIPADLAQLWAERYAFAAGYWGNFGGLNVPMPTWVYTILNLFAILAALGLVVRFGLWAVSRKSKVQSPKFKVNPSISNLWPFSWDAQTAARALAWAWPAAVFVSWIRWATVTWSSQGRLIFSAMPMWALALALPMANGKWQMANGRSLIPGFRFPNSKIQNLKSKILAAFLFVLCLAALPAWIVPAYTLPRATRATLTTPPLRADFGNVLRLDGFKIDRRNTAPGETVSLTLQWTALAPTTTDHSLFIHVLGKGERIIAQRDTFPGRGLLSTTWIEPGRTWIEHYEIPISALAYAPDSLTFAVGMYETATGARLPVQAEAPFVLTTAGDAITFGDVWLSEPTQQPTVQFGKGIALTGYELSDVLVRRGETLGVTLHWRCIARVDDNYTISVQLIDEQWRKAAQSDAWPLDGAAPTSSWQMGQRVDESRTLTIAADAPPGVYNLQLAIYRLNAAGTLEHLPIVWEKGQMPAKTVVLTRVRVQ
ncbi:MAG TPA: glycosyltransferase family 39 protein [Anaerolineae bacterium]|nr:glycosyltransferase family 39 protein [Anaerolineae bacterium]HQK12773.1 glycosyltransferase family 39 protein [Anaerolineae bacterium]